MRATNSVDTRPSRCASVSAPSTTRWHSIPTTTICLSTHSSRWFGAYLHANLGAPTRRSRAATPNDSDGYGLGESTLGWGAYDRQRGFLEPRDRDDGAGRAPTARIRAPDAADCLQLPE